MISLLLLEKTIVSGHPRRWVPIGATLASTLAA
jgi:hypothetical protein